MLVLYDNNGEKESLGIEIELSVSIYGKFIEE